MVVEDGVPETPRARAFAGTCPDCCGDLAVTPIEGGWVLGCVACGATIHGQRRIPARASELTPRPDVRSLSLR